MKLKLMIIFLSIALIFVTSGCDLIKVKPKRVKSAQVAKAKSTEESKTQNPISNPTQKDDVKAKNNDPVTSSEKPRSLSYTRENPFIPLISDQSKNNPKTTPEKSEEKRKKISPNRQRLRNHQKKLQFALTVS